MMHSVLLSQANDTAWYQWSCVSAGLRICREIELNIERPTKKVLNLTVNGASWGP